MDHLHGYNGELLLNKKLKLYLRLKKLFHVLLMVVVSLVAIFGLMKALPSAFLPTEDQGYLLVTTTTPDAASTSRTSAAINDARQVIESVDGVVAQASASGFDLLGRL